MILEDLTFLGFFIGTKSTADLSAWTHQLFIILIFKSSGWTTDDCCDVIQSGQSTQLGAWKLFELRAWSVYVREFADLEIHGQVNERLIDTLSFADATYWIMVPVTLINFEQSLY